MIYSTSTYFLGQIYYRSYLHSTKTHTNGRRGSTIDDLDRDLCAMNETYRLDLLGRYRVDARHHLGVRDAAAELPHVSRDG